MTSLRVSRVVSVSFCASLLLALVASAAPRHGYAQDDPVPIPSAGELDAVGSGLTDVGPVLDECVTCGDCCCCCPCCPWQVWANALFLSRNVSGSRWITWDGPKENGRRRVPWEDSYAWGPSVGLTFCPDPCNTRCRVGVEFYGIPGWTSTLQDEGNISVQFPSFPYLPELTEPGNPDSGYGVATFRYDSNLYNTEVNLYHQSNKVCWLTFLAGFRWIEIGEEFGAVFETGGTTPNYVIDVNNHLYGFQVGTLALLQECGPWRFDGWLKLGVYGNSADQLTVEDFTSAGGQVVGAWARDSNVAASVDMGIAVIRRITDCLNFRFSYMGLWVEGIATAPNQLDNSDPSNAIATLDNDGGVFFHGGFIGGELLW